jgi:hypothetical protein
MELTRLYGQQRALLLPVPLHPHRGTHLPALRPGGLSQNVESHFNKGALALYSAVFAFFLLVFAGMWIKEVLEVAATGTARAYDIAPTAFWMVRVFDLGFSIPLGLISVYLLWARPNKAFPIICLFYGFFFTQIVAVLAMGWAMFLRKDPTFLARDLVVFSILALIIAFGFFYVRRNYRIG